VKVVGCGGIGGALVPILCRYLNYALDEYSTVEITLIDRDSYEARNAALQAIDTESNKAQAIADLPAARFPRICFRAKPDHLANDNVVAFLDDGDVIFRVDA
jgi:tRNA A37 threonylcarbamoyladenosine dehydratase